MGCCAEYICDGDGFFTFVGNNPSTEAGCNSNYCYVNCYGDEGCRGQADNIYSPYPC
jgi:hypothetical protein